jgi:hypothetical protein
MILSVHEQIVRAALGEILAPQVLRAVIAANKRSDLHQLAAERHFDNGPDRETLCALRRRGLDTYLARTVAAARPTAHDQLANHRAALHAYGLATHALADFYSHTNWVELAVEREEEPLPAPLLDTTSTAADLPDGLQSGYFSLRYGLGGCPRCGGKPCPPLGYRYCHAQLNKDAPDQGHGAEHATADGSTHHELAVRLAVASTRASWESLSARLGAAYGDAARWVVPALAGKR